MKSTAPWQALQLGMVWLLIVLLTPSKGSAADYQSITTSDPDITLESLRLRVIPLEKEELLVETEAWQDLLKAKATQIVELEIQEQSVSDEEKSALMQNIQDRIRERTFIADRMLVVMYAYQSKGGEIDVFKTYVSSVTGIQINFKEMGKTSSRVIAWLRSPEGGMRWMFNIFWFLVVLIVFRFLALIARSMIRKTLNRTAPHASELLKDFLASTVRKLVFFLGIMMALDLIGIKIGPFLAAFGAVGFILGFALQGTLGNLAAGIMILFHRPYDVGDFVTAGGVTGKVTSMNLASTSFLTADHQQVIVPNGSIWGDVITNITGSETRRVDLMFGIGYEDDMDQAEALIAEIVSQHPKILRDPAPTIKIHELGDSSVNIICRPWSKTSDYWDVYWDLTKQVKQRFDAAGISIPFPQRDVHLYQQSSS